MSDTDERAELIAAMYADPDGDGEEDLSPERSGADRIDPGIRAVEVTVSGRTVKLPSLAYVALLESQIAEQRRSIRRLEGTIGALRKVMSRVIGEVATTKRDLDGKMPLNGHD